MKLALDVALAAGLAVAFALQMLRWLRVLQREHYEPSSLSRFLGRWSSPQVGSARAPARRRDRRPFTLTHVLMIALVVTVLLNQPVLVVLVTIAYGVACPWGLSFKGRTSALHWTRRLTTIAVSATVVALLVSALGAFTVLPWLLSVAMVWAVPVLLDLATRALRPYEEHRAQAFVDQASARLKRVNPRVVAITGSYGKTSTKHHLAELLGPYGVVASPRSFNNRAGLSRAINENLADGTRVFVAEMGTYGPGEIASLVTWCVPEIAIITAIGPVHLERMKTLEVIDAAKLEVTVPASTVIVNVDDSRLARWPSRLDPSKRVRTAGSMTESADVRVVVSPTQWRLVVDGGDIGTSEPLVGVQPTNLACAIAGALELGVTTEQVVDRVRTLSTVANRANVVTAPSGVVVIDDTFNANPASAASALSVLTSLDLGGRRVLVTPGLIELGRDQYGENLALARRAASLGVDLVIVGRTNAVPLRIGYERTSERFDTRDEAVAWVREHLGPGDGVLYLNDLPDHYP